MENAEKLTEGEINVAKLGQISEEIDRNPYGENLLNILVEKYSLFPSELGKECYSKRSLVE